MSHRADVEALPLANAHYNRQSPASPQFVPPGRCLVLKTACRRALWVTSAPRYVMHAWPGAWMNTLFRNEGAGLSSELILEALAVTRHLWGDPPLEGCITFVDARQVRRKRDPGRCYRRAGFQVAGMTAGGLVALHIAPAGFPPAAAPLLMV